MAAERLLLVGAGHAHLSLLRHAHRLTGAGYDVTVVAPRWFHYSGTAAAVATGALPPEAGRVDVAALAAGRVRHHDALLADLDLTARTAATDTGHALEWDVVSFNIGTTVDGDLSPAAGTVAEGEQVLGVKPLRELQQLRRRLPDTPGRRAAVTVVGAGSTGVELAAQLALHPGVAAVTLLESGPQPVAALPDGAIRRVRRLLTRRGVRLRTGARVRAVRAGAVELTDGAVVPHDVAVLATGLAAPALLARLGLGDRDGIPVRATLQHRDHDDVYAVGDCAWFLPGPLARIGVHGVRQGPVLLESLLRRVEGPGAGAAPTYRPPRRALAVLDLGGGRGLAVRGRWWWAGRSALLLKRVIDRRWLRGYQRTAGPRD